MITNKHGQTFKTGDRVRVTGDTGGMGHQADPGLDYYVRADWTTEPGIYSDAEMQKWEWWVHIDDLVHADVIHADVIDMTPYCETVYTVWVKTPEGGFYAMSGDFYSENGESYARRVADDWSDTPPPFAAEGSTFHVVRKTMTFDHII